MSGIVVPDTKLQYQGAGLQLFGNVGPFKVPGANFGLTCDGRIEKEVQEMTFRPVAYDLDAQDPCTSEIHTFFDQNGTEWDMVFRITTDPGGGVVNTAFALDVISEYPTIRMSIPKTVVSQGGFGVLQRAVLPRDYDAELVLRFWQRGVNVPLDGWVLLEVGYIKEAPPPPARGHADPSAIPLVVQHRVTLLPAPGAKDAWVIGDNYRR